MLSSKNQKGFIQLGLIGVLFLIAAIAVGTNLATNPDFTLFNISEEAKGVGQQSCSGCQGEYLLTWRRGGFRGRDGEGRDGFCIRQKSAACRIKPTPKPTPKPACIPGGCNGELCLENTGKSPGVSTICVYKEEYACYKSAKCEKQTDGKCGWTQTSELSACLSGRGTPLWPTEE